MTHNKSHQGFLKFSKKSILIIGYGSIGERHARLFTDIEADVIVISRRARKLSRKHVTFYSSISEIPFPKFDYIIIACETSLHLSYLQEIQSKGWAKNVPILIEKPLTSEMPSTTSVEEMKNLDPVFVGFNLRFLPIVQAARDQFDCNEKLIRAEFESHSYLPHWRPQQDYRLTSSASRASGGGVLRDLSHELDLMQWFAGTPKKLNLYGGKLSNLEVNVEDNVVLVGESETCKLIRVSLSYSQHFETRRLTVISEQKSVVADLMTGKITIANSTGMSNQIFANDDFDNTYRDMHYSIVFGDSNLAANIDDGLINVEMIESLTFQVGNVQ